MCVCDSLLASTPLVFVLDVPSHSLGSTWNLHYPGLKNESVSKGVIEWNKDLIYLTVEKPLPAYCMV